MRNYPNWLQAYVDYAGFSEAPMRMHFWSGVSAVAGALRRRVWLDMDYFKWHVNHYIIFVAPPGIVSKSTTVATAINLLRQVPGIKFGPDVITWPALVTAFAESSESFEINGDFHAQCALTLESSEFGNLVNPQDREMIDLLVTLWDGKQGSFRKITKTSGKDMVENPWINMIACTTPAWIAGNFPEYVIGGGFTSRCLFVYAEEKQRLVPYPSMAVPKDFKENQAKLVQDLEHISLIRGEYKLSKDATIWGAAWYKHHHAHPPVILCDDRFDGYLARKQTHLHKLAIVIAAAHRDELVVEVDDLITAEKMVSDLEKDMPKVFAKIGRTEESIHAEAFIKHIHSHPEGLLYSDAYRFIHLHFPNMKEFEGIVTGAIQSRQIEMVNTQLGMMLKPIIRRSSNGDGRTESPSAAPVPADPADDTQQLLDQQIP